MCFVKNDSDWYNLRTCLEISNLGLLRLQEPSSVLRLGTLALITMSVYVFSENTGIFSKVFLCWMCTFIMLHMPFE